MLIHKLRRVRQAEDFFVLVPQNGARRLSTCSLIMKESSKAGEKACFQSARRRVCVHVLIERQVYSLKKLILIAALISLSACQGGEADANASGTPAQQSAGTAASPTRAPSTASWSGGSTGELRFETASCIVMNGEIINFYAPAHAKDAIGEQPVLPQINGTKAGQGWALNILVSQGVTHSGGGNASNATSRTLTLSGDMLDGSSAARGAIGTVSANLLVECTDVDDLGS